MGTPSPLPRSGSPAGESGHAVYMALRGWLRRGRATGAVAGWCGVRALAERATVEIGHYVSPSYLGYVILREYPGLGTRVVLTKQQGVYERETHRKQYFFEELASD